VIRYESEDTFHSDDAWPLLDLHSHFGDLHTNQFSALWSRLLLTYNHHPHQPSHHLTMSGFEVFMLVWPSMPIAFVWCGASLQSGAMSFDIDEDGDDRHYNLGWEQDSLHRCTPFSHDESIQPSAVKKVTKHCEYPQE
jgi:hypothetical protein